MNSKKFSLIALGIILSVCFIQTSHAKNFDDSTKDRFIVRCTSDLPLRLKEGALPNLENTCSCIMDFYQDAPSTDPVNWDIALAPIDPTRMLNQDRATVNAMAFTAYYPVALKDEGVLECITAKEQKRFDDMVNAKRLQDQSQTQKQ